MSIQRLTETTHHVFERAGFLGKESCIRETWPCWFDVLVMGKLWDESEACLAECAGDRIRFQVGAQGKVWRGLLCTEFLERMLGVNVARGQI